MHNNKSEQRNQTKQQPTAKAIANARCTGFGFGFFAEIFIGLVGVVVVSRFFFRVCVVVVVVRFVAR